MSSPRRLPYSPSAASPLDVDDLLAEILLRLPPQPSSLPRASAVCKHWCCLISDRRFLRRFRIHHRRNPPLLGCFHRAIVGHAFTPRMDLPNRVPPGHFSFQRDHHNCFLSPGCRHDLCFLSLGCCHGLVLISDLAHRQFIVWDPLTRHQHQVAIPPGIDPKATEINGSVVRVVGDVHLQVVFVGSRYKQALACVYSSETGLWGDLVSTSVPDEPGPFDFMVVLFGTRICPLPALMVGGSLYWICGSFKGCSSILEFDLQKQSLTVIKMPMDVHEDAHNFMLIRADGGGLGFLFVSDFTAQIWKRKTDCDGVASWVLGRTIELDKLLSLNPEVHDSIRILGFAEENNVVLLQASTGVYEAQLQSLQFKLFTTNITPYYHPFESVYTADIGGEHDGAELVHNA